MLLHRLLQQLSQEARKNALRTTADGTTPEFSGADSLAGLATSVSVLGVNLIQNRENKHLWKFQIIPSLKDPCRQRKASRK